MTRHSPSEAALGEIPVSGLHANFTLLSAFNDAVGKEVLLELVDGSVFTGIFGGASSEMEVGLYCAYEKTAENEKNLLPLKKEIVQKRQFAFSDIVCVTVPTSDEKMIRGFATDRDYHNKRRTLDDEDELEMWEGDGEDVDLESDEAVKAAKTSAARNGGGWSVHEMFATNEKLGVGSTFNPDLTQYTTATVEGTDEDRRRAEEIARQIEKSGSSRMYSALENDDEERDLDKTTDEADLLGYETKNKNWSNGSPTAPPVSITNENGSNGVNGSASMSSIVHQNGQTPRPPSLMNAHAPPGFPPGFSNGGFTTVLNGRGRKGTMQSDHPHNTYLPLANRGVNNNGRGGSQMTPKNNRADALKGEPRRTSSGGGGVTPGRGGPPLPSPKGQGGQGNYVKRDSYEGPGGGGGQPHNYDSWNKGGMKTFENTKMKDQNQKMMLENRNAASNSPRNTGGAGGGGGPPPGQNQKGGASGRVEGLKAWQKDFNPTFQETRPSQKGSAEKVDSQPQTTPIIESAPPTKNAWQSGPPSGLTSSSRSEESKNAAIPSSSNIAPTPAEMKMAEERERKEEVGPSTSHEEDGTDESGSEKKEDADVSKDSAGNSKKFSFNPDAPAFTPKFGGATGGGMAPPSLPQTPIMVQSAPMAPTLITAQGIPMQATPMGAMGTMQQPIMYYPQQFANMQQNMQFSAVVNGGGIMAGAAQNGQGQTGGAPSTPRGTNGGQGTGMGTGPRQRPGTQGATGGAVPVTMPGQGMYMQPGVNYQHVPIQQQPYMQSQPYYQYNAQPQMIQAGTYAMPMSMQQQGMMGQPQRTYVPQPTHPGMMMQYNVQQQYGGGPPPGVNPQHGGGTTMGSGPQGGGGSTPSASTTNGGPPTNGGGQGGAANAHPPSQPPTPGAVPSQNGGGPPQGGMMPPQGGPPGMAPPPVPSPGMYGMQYGGPGVMYYNQSAAQMGGMEMHGGEGGGENIHPMPYQYNAGQYYQNAPPHLRAAYSTMSHGMQQQPQHAPAQPSQSQN